MKKWITSTEYYPIHLLAESYIEQDEQVQLTEDEFKWCFKVQEEFNQLQNFYRRKIKEHQQECKENTCD